MIQWTSYIIYVWNVIKSSGVQSSLILFARFFFLSCSICFVKSRFVSVHSKKQFNQQQYYNHIKWYHSFHFILCLIWYHGRACDRLKNCVEREHLTFCAHLHHRQIRQFLEKMVMWCQCTVYTDSVHTHCSGKFTIKLHSDQTPFSFLALDRSMYGKWITHFIIIIAVTISSDLLRVWAYEPCCWFGIWCDDGKWSTRKSFYKRNRKTF